jgi:hypothetical protein
MLIFETLGFDWNAAGATGPLFTPCKSERRDRIGPSNAHLTLWLQRVGSSQLVHWCSFDGLDCMSSDLF